ncbi:2-C-methyl-D-erythritol 4-phosphate cytidylyltransferase [Alkalimarinus alittae]|uniref:2-C-methyl-D-erythritol 4-phosphate cytidylyltransferase n=1 Tax=Alkalimarinus alittae TaxID=2961619 RepID=A0ABY6N5F3_9ALTE|nr:2-C-methyl-D-erythritol 4-phosphate cytidylyltransferase [Alkalimarinus alittae]UZE97362.1 2-C-methyl-D-erythritol 4-phosphate cytidylyltransferase [Alkalimarinus alittae]
MTNPTSAMTNSTPAMTKTSPPRPSIKYWVIVPAAGVGSRMNADRPKQYLPLSDKTVIEHTLEKLLSYPLFDHLLVGVSVDDQYWERFPISCNKRVVRFDGGKERVDTVLNGLQLIADRASPDDWVLVHDVARPCITLNDIDRMVKALEADDVGGILGVPVADTVKKVVNGGIVNTVDRSSLWRAYTPQMFRYQALYSALENGLNKGVVITDEASAMEAEGLTPKMIQGSAENIKITQPGDLHLAEIYLSREKDMVTR